MVAGGYGTTGTLGLEVIRLSLKTRLDTVARTGRNARAGRRAGLADPCRIRVINTLGEARSEILGRRPRRPTATTDASV